MPTHGLGMHPSPRNITEPAADAKGYTEFDEILRLYRERDVTLVHPGYGFLSENAGLARRLEEADVKLLGPSVQVIENMGLKHCAQKAGIPVVPGPGPSRLAKAKRKQYGRLKGLSGHTEGNSRWRWYELRCWQRCGEVEGDVCVTCQPNREQRQAFPV